MGSLNDRYAKSTVSIYRVSGWWRTWDGSSRCVAGGVARVQHLYTRPIGLNTNRIAS
ncbi:hypothetical protein OGM63_13115 [Plectonema radiosum NIES-515]|uniref:Uncharacterized protein n=1 Tax=Plectonema radiosum NIES-515 TaxID=2986073 RepID=A0ABT3B0C7_9CYAN|nr:hypothetical protein [Plectonema radiosum]MCV3214440.1 hypothetical protein [Plectonema radiosum NIES-515]